MTLNGAIALISRFFTEFDCFAGPLRHSGEDRFISSVGPKVLSPSSSLPLLAITNPPCSAVSLRRLIRPIVVVVIEGKGPSRMSASSRQPFKIPFVRWLFSAYTTQDIQTKAYRALASSPVHFKPPSPSPPVQTHLIAVKSACFINVKIWLWSRASILDSVAVAKTLSQSLDRGCLICRTPIRIVLLLCS